MTVLPFTAPASRSLSSTASPLTGTASPLAAPAAVTGSFGSPTGRGGRFTGSYRLEHCGSLLGQLTAAGVFAGELTDADGSPIGISARRTARTAQVTATATALLLHLGPLQINLLGLRVTVHQLTLDLAGTPYEPAVRATLQRPTSAPRLHLVNPLAAADAVALPSKNTEPVVRQMTGDRPAGAFTSPVRSRRTDHQGWGRAAAAEMTATTSRGDLRHEARRQSAAQPRSITSRRTITVGGSATIA